MSIIFNGYKSFIGVPDGHLRSVPGGESGGNGRTCDLAERYRFCDPFAERESECKGTAFLRHAQEGTPK